MRIVVWCLVMLVTGVVVGGLMTKAEFAGVKESFDPNSGIGRQEQEAGMAEVVRAQGGGLPTTPGAVAETPEGVMHDFGIMEVGGKGEHEFVIHNGGSATLNLESGGTSCQSCTISKLATKQVEPGQSTRVKINWNVVSQDPDFRKEAYIHTSDPKRSTIILTIKGKSVKSIRLEDDEIRLGSVSAADGRSGTCRIYCFRPTKLEIVGTTYSNPESDEFFDAALRPLTEEELATREGALQGFELTVTAKPGLPLGSILQTIQLETNWSESKKLDIPIRGTVVSDISIIGGKGFESHGNIFRFDVVPRDEGRKMQAQISIKGAERNDVKLEVSSIEPAEAIRVTLGEPKPINNGAVILVPLTVEIPPGAPRVSRLGGSDRKDYGRVIIKTTHSVSKELQLLVRFAVE